MSCFPTGLKVSDETIRTCITFLGVTGSEHIAFDKDETKVSFFGLSGDYYLCILTPSKRWSQAVASNMSSLALELAIIIARRQSRSSESGAIKIPCGNDTVGEFEEFIDILSRSLINSEDSSYSALIFIDFERYSAAKHVVRFSFNDDVISKIQAQIDFNDGGKVFVARVEHDLLAVLVNGISPSESVAFEQITKHLEIFRKRLKDQVKIGAEKFFLTFKSGVRLFKPIDFGATPPQDTVKNLLKQTEFAMDLVNRDTGNPYLFFTDELHTQYQRKNIIEKELKDAMINEEFSVVYQPIFDSQKRIMGAEALLRWNSQRLGPVSPAEFIPIAEQSGVIIEIGSFVVEKVCQSLSTTFKALGFISINVSCIQLRDTMYADKLSYLLSKYPSPKGRLRIEITESVAMTNLQRTKMLINNLTQKGVLFMLDDFGTGHSSLSYLHELPLHTVKVDRCFIDGIHASNKKQAIVASVNSLAKSLGLEVIVEGVEDPKDFEYLKNKSTSAFQGYLLSKPISKADFVSLLKPGSETVVS